MNFNLVILLKLSCVILFNQLQIVYGQCWGASYGRGVGTIPSTCPNGQEKDAGLCYDKCDDGYNGVATFCWENCSDGYEDIGALCLKNARIYGKGCCCVKVFGKKHCCNKCDDGYRDDGCTCRRDMKIYGKKTYDRGTGSPMGCKEGEEKDAGLCYPKCRNGFEGVGPVCWFKGCNGYYDHPCGLLCTQNEGECASIMVDIALASTSVIASIIEIIGTVGASPGAWIGAGSDVLGLTSALINDVCENPNKLATRCWKSVSDSGFLANCGGNNTKDCGLFCASSNVQCAKISISMISGVAGIVSLIGGDATSLAKFKTQKTESIDKAKNFVKNFNADMLKDLLKNWKKLFELENAKRAYEISDGLKGIAELVAGQIFSSKIFYFYIALVLFLN